MGDTRDQTVRLTVFEAGVAGRVEGDDGYESVAACVVAHTR
jgi:hypothetical protein